MSAPTEPSRLERTFRALQPSQTGSSSHVRPSGAERVRCRKRRQVRRLRTKPSRALLKPGACATRGAVQATKSSTGTRKRNESGDQQQRCRNKRKFEQPLRTPA